ncbi:MAG: hypothetical protein JO340_18495 [Acidobacteriaceae bacterium]|nr:hypothetical protein [Acidobacteriaceae bacterium]
MPGRGPQTFKKRQKEQQRKERSQEKFAKRMQRKADRAAGIVSHEDDSIEPALDSEDMPAKSSANS